MAPEAREPQPPLPSVSWWVAALPVALLIGLLFCNVKLFGDSATSGPNQLSLLFAAAAAAVIGRCLRIPFKRVMQGIVASLSSSLTAILILLLIGGLTGAWMVSGIVPAMIYYGLQILTPKTFLPAALAVCCIVSLATGSSWTTVGTVGVALLGIGQALGFSQPVIAGAIISGAYFGDKISPLSDTTNLAPAMAGTDLFTHVRYMLWTTVPSITLSFVIFLLIGLFSDVQGSEIAGRELSDAIRGKFYVSPWLFVVPAFVLVAVVMKVDATVALFAAMILGAATAVAFQPSVVRELADRDGSYAVQSYVAVHRAIGEATALTLDHPAAAELIQTKGMAGMLSTIWLIVCAMCFGGAMEGCGLLQRLTRPLVQWAQSTASLIAATAASCLVVNVTASDQYLAIVVPGRMFRKTFRERGLAPQNLSRTLEDSGTVTSVLVPWNTCGATQAGVLKVATMAYAPYCFFNIISPFMTVIFAALNIAIARQAPQSDEEN